MVFLLIIFVMLFVCFCTRFYLLKNSLKEAEKELREIQKDVGEHRVLHLPVPDKDLESLMSAINDTLYEIREERKKYAKREREFQSQIEAVSHDLRTPLTVILGYLKLLQKSGKNNFLIPEEEQHEMQNTVIRKAQAMERLIAQFYDYSRLHGGDYEVVLDKIDMGRVLREVFVDNCLILEQADLKVETHFPDFPVFIKGNKDALERIFVNLLQNAGRYAYSYVKLEMEREENQVRVVFENDTVKLGRQDIPYLFQRFYRKDISRNQVGSGLGLTIAKSLAEEMGGRLEAFVKDMEMASKDDGGDCIIICFALCFPLVLAGTEYCTKY